MKYCFVKQDGIKDCGAACLLMIIRTYKGNCSKEYLKDLTNTTKDGTTAYNLMKAGEKFHFTTFGLRGEVEELEEGYLPVIAHVIKEKTYQHFVVIYKVDKIKQELIIADPSIGIQKISMQKFKELSTKQYIVFIQNTTILNLGVKHPIYKELKRFITNQKYLFLIIILLSFTYTCCSILVSFCLQILMDYALTSYSNYKIFVISIFFLMITTLKCILQYVRLTLLIQLTHKLDTVLFENVYHHLFLLPENYYQNRTTGEILAKVTDLNKCKEIVSKLLLSIGVDSIMAVITLAILSILNLYLTLLLLVFIALDFLIYFIIKPKLKRKIAEYKEDYAQFHSFLTDTITSCASIRHIGCEEYVEREFHKKHQTQLKRSVGYQKCWNTQLFFKNTTHNTCDILLMSIGCVFIIKGQMSISQFMTYWFLSTFFLNPIDSIYEFLIDFQEGKESLERIEDFYQVQEEEKSKKENIEIHNLELANINFMYRKNELILENLSITFSKGEKILIYGKSGCGKSTLIKILSGYINSYQGKILINKIPITENKEQFLRTNITYVSQEESLLNMSLKDNIIMGRNISDKKFLQICKMLSIDEFASKNVLTYHMPIEENGNNLSGGERQRIILARSILKESDVYILDESLCNMDIYLERKILINIFEYLKDKLVIVVSHRFYNADLYDREIEMKKGGKYAEIESE